MVALLEAILSFPTVLFTVPLGLCLLYWLFVIVGAFDIEMLDAVTGAGEAADGAIDGAVEAAVEGTADAAAEAAVEGVMEGAAEGALDGIGDAAVDGVAEGAVEGAADGAIEGAAHAPASGLAMVLSLLRIGKVPITITFSLMFLFGWLLSATAMAFLGETLAAGGLLGMLAKTGVAIGSLLGGGAITSVLTRPLERVFSLQEAASATQLVGKTGRLTTSSVRGDFGQASVSHRQADLVLQVRCAGSNALKKGDDVVIVAYDKDNNTYTVRPPEVLARPHVETMPAATGESYDSYDSTEALVKEE
ncbi:hypothetical protein ACFL6C_06110 [Myxococcota bacterium]